MKIILCIWALLIPWGAEAIAIQVVYYGQPPRERRQLEKHLASVEKHGGDSERLADSAVIWLRDNGYLDGSARPDGNRLVVAPANRYVLDRLLVTADSTFGVAVGVPFTRSGLEEAIEQLLGRYREGGHYFVGAALTRVVKDSERVTVELRLSKGPVVTIGDHLYSGLSRTKPEIISKYHPTGPGDTLNDVAVRRSEEAAERIEFLDFEPPVLIRPRGGYTEADLEFRFREKKQFLFFGGGGYIPDNPTGVVWNVNLGLLNLFGAGREVAISSERREQGRNILDVTYRQPLFLLGIGQAELGVATRDYRDQFYEFAMRLEYSARVSRAVTTGLGLGWKRVEPSTDAPGYSRFTAAFSLGRWNLDDKWNPSRGLGLDWTVTYAYRRYSGSSGMPESDRHVYNETHNAVAVELYRPLIAKLVGHVGLSYIGLETNEAHPPVAELTFVGGPGTLRGFRNEQFAAQRTALGTLEPRLRFLQGYLFGFYDGAYINRPMPTGSDGSRTDEFFRYGYGVGMALVDRQRSLKLSIGWNEEAAFDRPRLSIQFSSDF